jgi:hypothetical protein
MGNETLLGLEIPSYDIVVVEDSSLQGSYAVSTGKYT